MESSNSSQKHRRECPNDYEPDKFKIILNLYDKLDNIIDITELKSIDIHIKNNIMRNKAELEKNENYKSKYINLLEEEWSKKQVRILEEAEAEFNSKRRDINNHFENKQKKIEEEIRLYETMNCHEDTIMSVVSKDNQIDFWEFYEYMKKRTGDIKY